MVVELASEPERRQELWRAFLAGPDDREKAVRRGNRAIGEEEFRVRMQERHGRPQRRRRGRPRWVAGTAG
jgi:hypothetical protein